MTQADLAALMTVQQAVAILDSTPVSPRITRVALGRALGLRLAEDLFADRDYPPFDRSMMDGFAVRSEDLRDPHARLAVVGEVAAGVMATRHLTRGQAMAIMTGAPLPSGADGVVPVEHVEQTGNMIRIAQPVIPGRYVSRRGSELSKGAQVLNKGTLLDAAHMAVAATVGAAELSVYARPRVAVLGTGDELVDVDERPTGAQIRNSNNTMLTALFSRMGCQVNDLGFERDDFDRIGGVVSEASLKHDVLVISGGVSMGQYDHVPRLLETLGAQLKIAKIRIKPGKPFLFGVMESRWSSMSDVREAIESDQDDYLLQPRENRCYVFGLPGNPVSSFVCAVRLVSRLIGRLLGGQPSERWRKAALRKPLPSNGPREFYQPALLQNDVVDALEWKGSGDVFTLAQANALLVREENEPAQPAGAAVRVLEI